MADFINTQNSFAKGEVAPEFYAKSNIDGLSKLENMDVLSGGGLKRRPGLKYLSDLSSSARLIPFSVSETENYLLVLTDGHILVFNDSIKVRDLIAPWAYSDIDKLQYAQRFGTMIFVHPDYKPQILKKTSDSFEISAFQFSINEENMDVNIPFMKFDDASDIKITVSSNNQGNNYATFTTDKDFWVPEDIDTKILMLDKQWSITEYKDSKNVIAYVNGPYSVPDSPVSDWRESAFSTKRGWPCSITFHQDRLVFGGSRSWSSGVWLEWAISSKPLTPSAVDIKQHTSVGSVATRYLPPQKIEGATVFISGSKKDIRELSLDELSENYNADDLCALSKHLMQNPIDIAYNEEKKKLYVVMESGLMAVLNQNSALGVSAWGRYKTAGEFKSVAVINGETYVVVKRGEKVQLEKFSESELSDSGSYGFSFTAAALPFKASGHNASKIRIRKISARLLDTKTLFINNYRVALPNEIYEDSCSGYSGDVDISLLGTERNCMTSPWTISSTDNLPATVLSVTIYGYYVV